MRISILDLSAYLGIVAVGTVTINMLLGMLIAVRYSPVRCWPYRRFNYFRLHNWSGYVALSASLLHPLTLFFNRSPKFTLFDLAYPLHSPSQPLENTFGAIALYLVSIVLVTSYFRTRIHRRLWKAFHFTIYLAAASLFFHGLLTDPNLKNMPDWLDGGKIFIELCLLLIVGAALLRWYYFRKDSHRSGSASRRAAALP